MADKNDNTETYEGPVSEAPVEAPEGAEAEVAAPAADEVREPQAVVVQGDVPAQVAPAREPDNDVVPVHETSVTLDEVITDPNSPLAVQVPEPDAAAGSLPIHALANPVPEDVFADKAAKASKVSDKDREERNATGLR
jgi:hypothetical protein